MVPKSADLPEPEEEETQSATPLEVQPTLPDHLMTDEEVEGLEVEYSTRGPNDWVLSGPLGAKGGGPGRRFFSIKQAETHARNLHGDRVMGRIKEATLFGGNRWAFLIKAKES